MSQNYDNWERLVAAVVKREQIWQLCHQDSISTISSSDYSCRLQLNLPVSLGSFSITDTFESIRRLRQRNFRTTDLVRVVQDVQVSDQQYLATGTKAVIKSLNTRKITEDEFEQHMIVLGNCRHENVATPSAYYFSETTKLIVYDYYSQGSVSDMLQDNKRRPNWESRLRIAIGAARGIAHIHTQCEGKLAHGNIKSSNIFLNSQHYGCVSDFGLAGIPEIPPTWWDALEYYSSEHDFKSPSQKSDVYSFGLVLLRLVTGKSDALILNGFPFVDELDELGELDVQQMLQIAKKCLAELPEERPTMSHVVLELENLHDSSHLPALSSFERPKRRFFPFRR